MNRLREVRVIRRVTQFRLRLETGIHPSKISLIENDLVEPTADEKIRLASALGVTIEEIFEDGEPTVASGKNNQRRKAVSEQK